MIPLDTCHQFATRELFPLPLGPIIIKYFPCPLLSLFFGAWINSFKNCKHWGFGTYVKHFWWAKLVCSSWSFSISLTLQKKNLYKYHFAKSKSVEKAYLLYNWKIFFNTCFQRIQQLCCKFLRGLIVKEVTCSIAWLCFDLLFQLIQLSDCIWGRVLKPERRVSKRITGVYVTFKLAKPFLFIIIKLFKIRWITKEKETVFFRQVWVE